MHSSPTSTFARFQPPSAVKGVGLAPAWAAGIAAFLWILGIITIWSSGQLLWALWSTDALKSIGMVIPVVSFLLILRVWHSLGWQQEGSWWGFALLTATAIIVKMREQTVLVLVLGPFWSIYLPPASVVVFAYGIGIVLLFGGVRLLRASRFPLLLLLFVNPIPHLFNVYIDLPLQRASAHIARAFAMALGQPLSPDKLRLMFTPDFGMFIAPGCNGIRGAITMGLIALVAGYLYRFRWRAHLMVVLAAVLLGYLFNFVRLCVLVLFYLVALHRPWLQDRAENADYLIGAGLFFVAVYLLYAVIQKLGSKTNPESGVLLLPPDPRLHPKPLDVHGFRLRAGAFALLVAIGLLLQIRLWTAPAPPAELLADETSLGPFPQTIGNYQLARRWNENLTAGALLFHWAEYAPQGGGTHIAVGISPVLGSHDTLICHSARGEDPLWHAGETFPTIGDQAVGFSASFFNDGATQSLEATTLCNGSSCGEFSTAPKHFGLVYSKPRPETLLSQNPERPIPILLKAETADTTLPTETARLQLLTDVRSFLSGVSLDRLTDPYRRR